MSRPAWTCRTPAKAARRPAATAPPHCSNPCWNAPTATRSRSPWPASTAMRMLLVKECADREVIWNFADNLPLHIAYRPGKTRLLKSLNTAGGFVKDFPRKSITVARAHRWRHRAGHRLEADAFRRRGRVVRRRGQRDARNVPRRPPVAAGQRVALAARAPPGRPVSRRQLANRCPSELLRHLTAPDERTRQIPDQPAHAGDHRAGGCARRCSACCRCCWNTSAAPGNRSQTRRAAERAGGPAMEVPA